MKLFYLFTDDEKPAVNTKVINGSSSTDTGFSKHDTKTSCCSKLNTKDYSSTSKKQEVFDVVDVLKIARLQEESKKGENAN